MSVIRKASFIVLGWMFLTVPVALACHGGDLGAPAKGHFKWGKSSGILQSYEVSTISSFISTSCDFYTAFLEVEYDAIAEQAAQGEGEHLNVLASYLGCPASSHAVFGQSLRKHHHELFTTSPDPHALREGVDEMVAATPVLRQTCTNSNS